MQEQWVESAANSLGNNLYSRIYNWNWCRQSTGSKHEPIQPSQDRPAEQRRCQVYHRELSDRTRPNNTMEGRGPAKRANSERIGPATPAAVRATASAQGAPGHVRDRQAAGQGQVRAGVPGAGAHDGLRVRAEGAAQERAAAGQGGEAGAARDRDPEQPAPPQHPAPVRPLPRQQARLPHPRVRRPRRAVQAPAQGHALPGVEGRPVRGPDGRRAQVPAPQARHAPRHQAREHPRRHPRRDQDLRLRLERARAQQPPQHDVRHPRLLAPGDDQAGQPGELLQPGR